MHCSEPIKHPLVSLLLSLICVAALHAEEDIYNPLSVGSRWKASVELTTPDGRTILGTALREITGTETIATNTYFKSVTRFDGIPGMTQFITYRRKTKDGIYAINGFDPQKREYLETGLPLAVGKTWTAITIANEKTVFTVESQETVTVGDHKYEKCFKVVYRSDGPSPSGHFYLAPNVGNVTETLKHGGATFRFTLKSFNDASSSTSSGQSKSELLAVWRAADTPIAQRLSVARSLLTTNMHTDEVEALLGAPKTRNRHNPGMPADAPPGTEHPRIRWWYDYQFKDGTVVVSFLQVMNVEKFEAELQSVTIIKK